MTTTTQQPDDEPPSAAPRSSGSPRRLDPSGLAAARCVSRLQRRYRQDNPAAVATLARLRRGAGRTAHEDPDHWGCDGLEDLAEILEPPEPARRKANSEAAQRDYSWLKRECAEEAVHLAVTLWALHQQSLRDTDMHVPGWSLGRAVRCLAREKTVGSTPSADHEPGANSGRSKRQSAPRADDELNEPLRKRFVRIGTSTSLDSAAVRLREMVLLLRDARIPLDYGRLADQLYTWQDENRRAEVRRAWGREFHLAFWQDTRTTTGNSGDIADAGPTASFSDYTGADDEYGPGE